MPPPPLVLATTPLPIMELATATIADSSTGVASTSPIMVPSVVESDVEPHVARVGDVVPNPIPSVDVA